MELAKSQTVKMAMAAGGNIEDREKIIHMYETVLNHTYQGKLKKESEANDSSDYGKWKRVQTTHLVYKIDEDNPIIITNIGGFHKGNHAEEQLIKELIKQGKVKEPGVTDKFEEMSSHKKNEKSKSLETKKENIHVTIYINNSPCSQYPHYCADELIDMLNNNVNVHLRLYVANLYNIRRESCKEEYHYYFIRIENHTANHRGLRNLMHHERCEIMAFTEDIWKELFKMTTGSDQLPDNYDNIKDGNDRSRGREDTLIQTDLDHIRDNPF